MNPTEIGIALLGPLSAAAVVFGFLKFSRGRIETAVDESIKSQFRKHELKIEQDLKKQLELLKVEQERVSERLKTQYSWVYVKRAKVMNEIYSNIVSTETASLAAVLALAGPAIPGPGRVEDAQRLAEENGPDTEMKLTELKECISSVERSFAYGRLLFAEKFEAELAKKIDGIVEFNEEIARGLEAVIDGRGKPIGEIDGFSETIVRRAAYEETKELIKRRFRELYGITEMASKTSSKA